MQLGVDSRTQVPLLARVRPWIALLVAAIVFALIPIIGLPLLFALPLIGLALALGAPPDHVADARAVARAPRKSCHRNLDLDLRCGDGAAATTGRLAGGTGWIGNVDLVGAIIAVAALALPLAMGTLLSPDRSHGCGAAHPTRSEPVLAESHDRLELGLLRHSLRANLLPHRLQLLNVLLC